MAKVICAGGAPSSGTTLFADLMDAVPGVTCPPELNIFNSAILFEEKVDLVKALSRRHIKTRSIYSRNNRFFNRKYLAMLNFTEESLADMAGESATSEQFLAALLSHLNDHLWRQATVLCEKSPTNALWAKEFCERFPDGLFVHVTRHGSDVVQSLMRRGYTAYEAALIWIYQVSSARRARDCPNFLEVKYENIIKNPFEFAADMASRVGLSATAEEIEVAFRQNEFRASLPRPRQWTVHRYTGDVHVPERADHADADFDFSWAEDTFMLRHSNPQPPKILGSFSDLLATLGYQRTVPQQENGERPAQSMFGVFKDYISYGKNLDLQRNLRLVTSATNYYADLVEIENAMIDNILQMRRKIKKLGGLMENMAK